MGIFCFILAAMYAVEVVAHYTFGYHAEWSDGNMGCTGLAIIALCLTLTQGVNNAKE